jgi:single-strand DNA-binding protein
MMNEVLLIGRLTKDPEMRETTNNKKVTKMTLAVDRDFKTSEGERETDFIDVTVLGKNAENPAKHLSKGRLVAVKGRLQISSYEDSQSIRRKSAEVIVEKIKYLDKPKESGQ